MVYILLAIACIMFAVSFALRNKWQFVERNATGCAKLSEGKSGTNYDSSDNQKTFRIQSDRAKKANKKWHSWQAAVQLSFFSVVALVSYSIVGLFSALTYMAVFWILFDGILNVFGLGKPFFYVGKTAFIDRKFQSFKKPSLAIAITKFTLLIALLIPYVILVIKN